MHTDISDQLLDVTAVNDKNFSLLRPRLDYSCGADASVVQQNTKHKSG